jgi:hypothetical protein
MLAMVKSVYISTVAVSQRRDDMKRMKPHKCVQEAQQWKSKPLLLGMSKPKAKLGGYAIRY